MTHHALTRPVTGAPVQDAPERHAQDNNAAMRAVVEKIFQKIWIVNEPGAFETLYHEDARISGIVPRASIGVEEFKTAVAEMQLSQEMLGYQIVDFIGDGQTRCAVTIEYDVFIPAADQAAKLMVSCFYTIEDGRARRVTITIDRLDLLENIGAVPEGAYFIGLSGGTFA